MPDRRFFESFPWRLIVADGGLDNNLFPGANAGATITFLDHLAANKRITYEIGRPATLDFDVPAWEPEINIPYTDAYAEPFLAEGNRLIYAFRNEVDAGASPAWVCRGAFIIMQVEDAGDANESRTHVTAYDPRQLLYYRKCINPQTLDDISSMGFTYVGKSAGFIAFDVLEQSMGVHGYTRIRNDLGYIQDTPIIDAFTIQQGMSVGEVWDELEATGKVEIYLQPIYDLANHAGYCCRAWYYHKMGVQNPEAVFAWDHPSRSLLQISNIIDGTQRANAIQFGVAQGLDVQPTVMDVQSRAKYGEYWANQWFPLQNSPQAIMALAEGAMESQKFGRRTVTMSPAAERSPIPLRDYGLGDEVHVCWSSNLRQALITTSRITSIPIELDDNQFETVSRAVVEPLVIEFPVETQLMTSLATNLTSSSDIASRNTTYFYTPS